MLAEALSMSSPTALRFPKTLPKPFDGKTGVGLHAREVTRGGRKIALTRTEYGLLELLMKRAGRVVTRENLIESVWGPDSEVRSNTLDAFIRLLRDKVDTDADAKLIQTVRGVGYCMRREEA